MAPFAAWAAVLATAAAASATTPSPRSTLGSVTFGMTRASIDPRTEAHAAEIAAALACALVAEAASCWTMPSLRFMSFRPACTESRMSWKADLPPDSASATALICATWSSAYADRTSTATLIPSYVARACAPSPSTMRPAASRARDWSRRSVGEPSSSCRSLVTRLPSQTPRTPLTAEMMIGTAFFMKAPASVSGCLACSTGPVLRRPRSRG